MERKNKNSCIRPLRIGSLLAAHNLVLAPLAGISNYPFRQICREFGAALTFTEMVSVDGLFYQNDSTRRLLQIKSHEKPVGFQFFGDDPEIFRRVIPEAAKLQPDIIDLNFGCPVRKVVSRGAGAALLKDLQRLQKIVVAVKSVTDIPVTAKIRTGWDADSIVVEDAAQAAEAAGADAVTVHARTRSQGYSGKASWDHIARVKDILKIPVIGNGDVFDIFSAEEMFRSTGADGIMLARGILGRPWLFQNILDYMENGTVNTEPPVARRIEILTHHYQMEMNEFGEQQALTQMRKNFGMVYPRVASFGTAASTHISVQKF